MVKSGIKIFARLKPTKKPIGLVEVSDVEDQGVTTLSITVPRSEASGFVNNKKEIYNFQFSQVFDQRTKQEEVFKAVAQGVIDNCLEGYNGTIFAYGQTGSGKTFTITGGAEKYGDRGIIPRTLTHLFQQYSKSPGIMYTTQVSYMEIYNESGYDLLDPEHETSALENLPKVMLLEGQDGNIHLKNLSLHVASNEEEALNWLFLGDTNRMIAETPMNMASTRSHCIFTIHISSREPGSDTIRKAKLHLVDLAGSERVGKSSMKGTLFTEATYINLSLHYLEQVIVALSEKSRTHIPYRNSMMTSVLRDSLGGNCMTTMIATCAIEKKNIDETISTCRFSQRVALVKNEALVNEELDPKLMVVHLKQKVQELKDELSLATGEERTEELTTEEIERCEELVQAYIKDTSPEASLEVGADMRKIKLCFGLLKAEIMKRREVTPQDDEEDTNAPPEAPTGKEAETTGPPPTEAAEQQGPDATATLELELLQNRLQQRDAEIRILLRLMKQERKRANRAEAALSSAGMEVRATSPASPDRLSPLRLARSIGATAAGSVSTTESSLEGSLLVAEGSRTSESGLGVSVDSRESAGGVRVSAGGERVNAGVERVNAVGLLKVDNSNSSTGMESAEWKAALKAELSRARQLAFDTFRKNNADTGAIDQHKKVLKVKYAEAKALGEKVNATRLHINKLKSQLEKHRIARVIEVPTAGASTSVEPDRREEELKRMLESEKTRFKELYDKLREMKTEIEHVQHLLQKSKVQIQRDFEEWWKQHSTNRKLSPRAAWHTPPLPLRPGSQSSAETTRQQEGEESPSGRGLSRHQEAIAAQMAHQQRTGGDKRGSGSSRGRAPSVLSQVDSNSSNRADVNSVDARPRQGSRVEGAMTTKHGGTGYQSSWQQADSISFSPRTATAQTAKLSSPGDQFLSKQRTLFPTGQNRDKGDSGGHSLSPPSKASSILLTGDPRADADILAFYKARQKLIREFK